MDDHGSSDPDPGAPNVENPRPQEPAAEGPGGLGKAASELSRRVQDGAEQVRRRAPEYLDQGQQQLQSLGRQIEQQVRRQPLASLLVAAGVGFVLGVLWNRR